MLIQDFADGSTDIHGENVRGEAPLCNAFHVAMKCACQRLDQKRIVIWPERCRCPRLVAIEPELMESPCDSCRLVMHAIRSRSRPVRIRRRWRRGGILKSGLSADRRA